MSCSGRALKKLYAQTRNLIATAWTAVASFLLVELRILPLLGLLVVPLAAPRFFIAERLSSNTFCIPGRSARAVAIFYLFGEPTFLPSSMAGACGVHPFHHLLLKSSSDATGDWRWDARSAALSFPDASGSHVRRQDRRCAACSGVFQAS
jgi:hypothetical protein